MLCEIMVKQCTNRALHALIIEVVLMLAAVDLPTAVSPLSAIVIFMKNACLEELADTCIFSLVDDILDSAYGGP